MLSWMLNSLGVTEEIQEKEPVLPLDQNSNRSSHRSIPLSTQYRIYNPNPYIVYSDYPNLDENTLAKVETTESTGSFAFKLLSRLAGLWFVTVAAGSVICSIPISAMGLPIILGVGIFCLVAIAIFKYIVRIWVHLLSLSWRLTKTVIMSPKHLIGVGFSLVRKVTHLIFHRNTPGLIDQHPYPTFPPLVRRQSTTSSKYTDRSFEDQYKWRYYDPQHVRPFIHSDDSSQVSLPHPHQFEVPIRSAPLNPQFLWLTKEHQERLDYCIQLYSSTTNLPADHFELLLGPQEDGSVHSILSLWNEPDPNVPLDYHYLIGFCQYYILPDRPHLVFIDKLNVSSEYSENGFSKRIIRKLMYSPNVHAIQVWSVWHAEPFYRGIGFKSVLETAESGKKPRPVEGEHGPLLMWTNDRLRLHEPVKTLRSVESLPNLKSRDSSLTLKSKDSMMSILGSGAYQHKKTNL